MTARVIKSLRGYRGALFSANGGIIVVSAKAYTDRNRAALAALELLNRRMP